MLVTILLLISSAVAIDGPWITVGRGVATEYHPWRKSPTVPYARYPGAWSRRPHPTDLVCAHRRLPFGAVLRLRYKGRTAFCVVLDRGSWGYCAPTQGKSSARCRKGYTYRVVVRHTDRLKYKGGYYRGLVDATTLVHRMLGSRGWVTVDVDRMDARVVGRRPLPVLRLKNGKMIWHK